MPPSAPDPARPIKCRLPTLLANNDAPSWHNTKTHQSLKWTVQLRKLFYENGYKKRNITLQHGYYSLYSVMGANIKRFNDKYCMDERNVYATWRYV